MQEQQGRTRLPAGARPTQPGDPATIGSYEVIGKLGEGGMGAVFLGKGPDGRLVAIKVIRPELAADNTFRDRFEDEVSHAQRVASFCTATVLAHGEEAGRPYMVTEFVDGTPLEDYVAAQGALPAGTLHGVAVGVAAALTAIHAAGLVHRDLKPSNVLLSVSGPRVIDFGIARATDTPSQHTQVGFVIGSPGWMAPEQVLRNEVSTAVDIFAWGCLVANAGTGRHPYGSGTVMTMAARAEQGEPDLSGLDEPLLGLVRRALTPDPAGRPPARELLLALVGGGDPTDPAAAAATELLGGLGGIGGAGGPGAERARDGFTAVADAQAILDQEIHRTWQAEALPPPWRAPSPPHGMPVRPPAQRAAPMEPPPGARQQMSHRPPPAPPPAPLSAQPLVGPQGPPPAAPPAAPYGGQAPGPQRRGGSGCLTAFLIVLAIAVIGGFVVFRMTRPVDAQTGEPLTDGQFTFQLTRPSGRSSVVCGEKAVVRGLEPAGGQFCLVRFTVVNTGDKERLLSAGYQRISDAEGNTEKGDRLLSGGVQAKNTVPEDRLGPDEKFTGTLVFRVPTGFEATELVFHDGRLSRGMRLTLTP